MNRLNLAFYIKNFVFALVIILNIKLSTSQLTGRRSEELVKCIEDSSDKKFQTFWTESKGKCSLSPTKLLKQYVRLTDTDLNDKCNQLILYNVRKKVVDVSSSILEEAILTNTLAQSKQLLEKLHALDSRIAEAVWYKVIDEVYYLVDKEDLANKIYNLDIYRAQVVGLLALVTKWNYVEGTSMQLLEDMPNILNTLFNNPPGFGSLSVLQQPRLDHLRRRMIKAADEQLLQKGAT